MTIEEIKQKTASSFEKFGISRASVFGSIARGEDTEKSDVDLLVSYVNPVSLIRHIHIENALSNILGREVDLATEKNLRTAYKSEVLKDAKIIYER